MGSGGLPSIVSLVEDDREFIPRVATFCQGVVGIPTGSDSMTGFTKAVVDYIKADTNGSNQTRHLHVFRVTDGTHGPISGVIFNAQYIGNKGVRVYMVAHRSGKDETARQRVYLVHRPRYVFDMADALPAFYADWKGNRDAEWWRLVKEYASGIRTVALEKRSDLIFVLAGGLPKYHVYGAG